MGKCTFAATLARKLLLQMLMSQSGQFASLVAPNSTDTRAALHGAPCPAPCPCALPVRVARARALVLAQALRAARELCALRAELAWPARRARR